MTDREKVIKGLELCKYDPDPGQENKGIHSCVKCPYYNDGIMPECQVMFTDAIKLLKEHEAVEPTLKREGRNKYYNDYVCPRCDNEVIYEQNYCSECGVKFIWEGR